MFPFSFTSFRSSTTKTQGDVCEKIITGSVNSNVTTPLEQLPDVADVASKLRDIVVEVDDKSRFLSSAVKSKPNWLLEAQWCWAAGRGQASLGEAHMIEHMCGVSYAAICRLGCQALKSEAKHILVSLVSMQADSEFEQFARNELDSPSAVSPVEALMIASVEPNQLAEQRARLTPKLDRLIALFKVWLHGAVCEHLLGVSRQTWRARLRGQLDASPSQDGETTSERSPLLDRETAADFFQAEQDSPIDYCIKEENFQGFDLLPGASFHATCGVARLPCPTLEGSLAWTMVSVLSLLSKAWVLCLSFAVRDRLSETWRSQGYFRAENMRCKLSMEQMHGLLSFVPATCKLFSPKTKNEEGLCPCVRCQLLHELRDGLRQKTGESQSSKSKAVLSLQSHLCRNHATTVQYVWDKAMEVIRRGSWRIFVPSLTVASPAPLDQSTQQLLNAVDFIVDKVVPLEAVSEKVPGKTYEVAVPSHNFSSRVIEASSLEDARLIAQELLNRQINRTKQATDFHKQRDQAGQQQRSENLVATSDLYTLQASVTSNSDKQIWRGKLTLREECATAHKWEFVVVQPRPDVSDPPLLVEIDLNCRRSEVVQTRDRMLVAQLRAREKKRDAFATKTAKRQDVKRQWPTRVEDLTVQGTLQRSERACRIEKIKYSWQNYIVEATPRKHRKLPPWNATDKAMAQHQETTPKRALRKMCEKLGQRSRQDALKSTPCMRATRLADDDLRTSNTSGAVRLRESLDHEEHLGIVSQSLAFLATMRVDNCHCHNCDEQWPCFNYRDEHTGY